MFYTLSSTVSKYLNFYYDFFVSSWRTMTPMEYTYVLCGIAFVGWLLMRSNMK